MPYVINKTCTKCGACILECPTGSIAEGKDRYLIDADTCRDHASCVSVCPVNAITKLSEHLRTSLKPKSSEEEEEET